MYRPANIVESAIRMRATMRRKRSADRLTYYVEEAGIKLGIGRTQAYDAAKNGELPTIRIEKRLLVPKAALDRMLAALPPATVERRTAMGGPASRGPPGPQRERRRCQGASSEISQLVNAGGHSAGLSGQRLNEMLAAHFRCERAIA